jgi:ATP-binding cassette subfamily F protein 3
LLLLDEPTNHLDIETIGWLESHLRSYKGGVLLVSHDRRFLDRVTNQTAELGSRSFKTYPVSYGKYLVQRDEELTRERALVERQQAFVSKTEDFIRKNIAGQKTKQAQSRRKMLDKLETVDRPEDIWADAQKMKVRFADAARSGDIVLDCSGMGAKRGDSTLFSGLDLLVRRGDRIGIVGPNGAGKSTLMKLIAGRGDPVLDVGTVKRGTNLQEGFFDQHLGELNPKNTAVEEIRTVRGDMNPEACRNYLARFRIVGDDALRPISGFSGGERSRLALAKLLLEPRNLLFLDEPTNHLDIPACEILEEALAEGYDGTLILVSHDRQFLETVTTRLVVMANGRAEVLPGGYGEYAVAREAVASDERQSQARPSSAPRGNTPKNEARSDAADGDARKRDHERRRQAARELERKAKRVGELEGSIATSEAALAKLRAELLEDPKGDWGKVAEKAEREREASRTLDAMVEEWTRLSLDIAADGEES